jgi:thymidine kinase
MAALTFYFSPMQAGKSALCLNTAFHLRQAGRRVLLATTHDRTHGQVASRVGLRADAHVFTQGAVRAEVLASGAVDVVLVDEAQFLSRDDVDDLAALVDDHDIEVLCYGLRTDFRGCMFAGSQRLFEVADRLEMLQVQALCWCGRAATHNARTIDGQIVREGETLVVDDGAGQTAYEVLCRAHHRDGKTRATVGMPGGG